MIKNTDHIPMWKKNLIKTMFSPLRFKASRNFMILTSKVENKKHNHFKLKQKLNRTRIIIKRNTKPQTVLCSDSQHLTH